MSAGEVTRLRGGDSSGPSEITPDTHVRLSLAKLIAALGTIIMLVFVAAVAWRGLQSAIERLGERLAVHIANDDVHIDKDYQKDHGRPVGKWDVDAYKAETTQAIEKLNTAVDQLRTELVKRRH